MENLMIWKKLTRFEQAMKLQPINVKGSMVELRIGQLRQAQNKDQKLSLQKKHFLVWCFQEGSGFL